MKPALLVSPLAFVGARCFFFFFKLRPTRACIWDPVTGKRIQWSLNALAESGTPEATLAAIQRQVIYSLPRAGMLVGTRVCMWGTSGGVRVGGSVGASAAWLSIRITLPPCRVLRYQSIPSVAGTDARTTPSFTGSPCRLLRSTGVRGCA
jgi:hypothetical protein